MLGGRASRDRSRRGDHAARWRTTPRNLATLSLPSGGRRCSRCHAAANALLLCLLLTAVDQDRRSAALLTLLFFVLLLFLFRLFLLLCCSTLSGHRYRLLDGCLLCVFPVWFSQILQTYLKSTRRTIMKQKVWGHGNSSKLFPQDCVSAMGRLFKHRMPSVLVNPSSIRRLVSICFGLLPRHSTWFSFRDDMVVTCAHALSRGSTLELHYERNKRPREDVLQMFLRSQFYVPALNRYEECLYGHGKVDAKHSVSLEPRTDLELTALRQAINSTRGPVQPTSEIFNDQDSKNATLESAREAVADESMDFGTSDSEPEYDTETPSFVFEEEGFFAVAASSEEGNVVACVEEVDLCQTGQEAQASNTGSQTTINQALCQAENFWRCVPPNISRAGFKSCQSCADFHSSFRKLNSRERAKTKEKYLSNTKKKLKTE